MRIRVTTRADVYEKCKREHIERGYRIEEDRPTPVNGFCSFVIVREPSASTSLAELVEQALNRRPAAGELIEVSNVTENPIPL